MTTSRDIRHACWRPLGALLAAVLCAAGVALSTPVRSQPMTDLVIGELTVLDRQYMDRQRAQLDSLARLRLGQGCCRDEDDIPVLQRLLDEGVVGPEQREELQAMGIVLGDILAAELGMDWVIYEDKLGRTRALRLGESDNYLFPATMISRRREAGNEESVREIYDRAHAAISARLPRQPYQ